MISLTSRSLVALAVAVAGAQAKNLISKIELDDLLKPVGLKRRRVHWGTTMAVLGAGIAVGSSAVLLLAPSAAGVIRERFVKNLEAGREALEKSDVVQDVRSNAGDDNHRSEGFHAAT